MFSIASVQTIILILSFIAPGFVINSIVTMCRPRRSETGDVLFLRFLTYSVLNVAMTLWAVPILLNPASLTMKKIGITMISLLIVDFVMPTILGLAIVVLDAKKIIPKTLDWLSLSHMHATPNAWDYKFEDVCSEGDSWVIIRLNNDNKIAGYFGGKSFASSDVQERDVFIEEIWDVDDATGNWSMRDRTDGIWLKSSEIISIEFLKTTRNEAIENVEQPEQRQEGA